MNPRIFLFITGFIAIASVALSSQAKSGDAQDFVRKAGIGNEFEIESSKLALDKTQSSNVRNLAKQMIDDHTKAGKDLESTLKSSDSGAKPPKGLDAKHSEMMNALHDATGSNFDEQFIRMQKQAHAEAVALFDDYYNNGSDVALKNFAGRTLPTLRQHQEHVQQF